MGNFGLLKLLKMNLIYCYDAYCGWCYAFSPVMKQIAQDYGSNGYIEVLSGGMLLPASPKSITVLADYLSEAYKTVEVHTGIHFGEDYLWHIQNPEKSDWFPHSEKPAIALSIIRQYSPELSLSFAAALQYALFFEGRDLTDDEAYRHLLPEYHITPSVFYEALHSISFKEKAHHDFALVKRLGISSFPVLLLQEDENRFHLIAKGYTNYETVKTRLTTVLDDIKTKHML